MAAPSRGGLFGSRTAAPTLSPIPLQPAPIPGSVFVRPQQVQTGGNAQALAQALSGLSRDLGAYADVRAAEDRDPNNRTNKDYLNAIQGKSAEELGAMAGRGEFANDIQEDGLSALLGAERASDFRLQTAEWYETEFDRNEGNLPEELERRRQEYAAALPNDAARASFFKATDDWSQRLTGRDLERRVETAKTARNDAVVSEFRIIGEEMVAKGKSPQETASEILRQSSLNRNFRGLTGAEQNATIFALAQEYALAGDAEMVKALLGDDRGGVGSVAKTSSYAVEAAKLMKSAEDIQDRERQKGDLDFYEDQRSRVTAGTWTEADSRKAQGERPYLNPEEVAGWTTQSARNRAEAAERRQREDEKRQLRQDAQNARTEALSAATGSMDRMLGATTLRDRVLPTESGGTTVYTAKEQEKDVVAGRLQQFAAAEGKLIEEGTAPAEARTAILRGKLNWFDGNGVVNPEWEALFNAAPIVASSSRLAAGGAPEARLQAVAEEFYQIRQLNPGYAASLVKDARAREFLETYADARSSLDPSGAADPSAALLEAARISNRPPGERAAYAVTAREVDEMVEAAFGGDADDYPPSVLETAGRLLRENLRREMPRAAAIEKVRTTLTEQSVEVNGRRIFGDGRRFPKDFAPAMETALEDWVATNGAAFGITSADEVYLEDIGDGAGGFAISSKAGGAPLAAFPQRALDGALKAYQDRETQKAAAWGRNVERDGWGLAVLKWVKDGFEVEGGSMSPEEARKFLADQDEKAKIDAWVGRQARKDGVTFYANTQRWGRPGTGFFGRMTVQHVEPVVTWSAREKSVIWRPVE